MEETDQAPRRATFCFVHAGDLHLDAPARGLALPPEPLRSALRDASLRAWHSLVELAIERRAAFLLLSGGIFAAGAPTLRACVALRDGIERLRAHGVDAFVALGPDDADATPYVPWLAAGATVFPSGEIKAAYAMRDGRCLAALRGTSGEVSGAAQEIRALQPLGLGIDIGVLPIAADEPLRAALESSPLHYWALGAGTPAAAPVLSENPWVVSPGTPQGRGLQADDLGPKGCVVVEVVDGRIAEVVPTAVDHVRFVSLDIDVGRCVDLPAMRRRLQRELDDAGEEAGERTLVAEAVLRGRLVHGIRFDRLRLETALLAELRAGSARAGSTHWWARVRDLTARDARPGAASPWDLRRILLEHSEALGAPLPGSRFLAMTFAPLLRQWGAETDMAAQRELIRDAAALALQQFGGEARR